MMIHLHVPLFHFLWKRKITYLITKYICFFLRKLNIHVVNKLFIHDQRTLQISTKSENTFVILNLAQLI